MTAIKPRTAKVVIYQGDDLDRLSELDRAVEKAAEELARATKAADNSTRLMHQDDPTAAAREGHDQAKVERDAFAEEAEDRGVAVVMHALPRKRWRELVEAHPARDGNPGDAQLGVNMSDFPDALLPVAIDREQSTIEGDTIAFLEGLSDYDYYDRLFLAAYALNRGSAVADPTLRLA